MGGVLGAAWRAWRACPPRPRPPPLAPTHEVVQPLSARPLPVRFGARRAIARAGRAAAAAAASGRGRLVVLRRRRRHVARRARPGFKREVGVHGELGLAHALGCAHGGGEGGAARRVEQAVAPQGLQGGGVQ